MHKVALVTGASSGIGKETAQLFARKGYTVYAAARRTDKMQELQALGVKLLAMEIAKEADLVNGVNDILQNEQRIDVLVNNAGYNFYGALEDVPLSEARYLFDVNIFGLARLTQLLLPTMRRQRTGKIVNVSSIGGKFGEPHGTWYHATKFALEGLSDILRMELKQFGIDVIVIEPGAVVTEMLDAAGKNLLKMSGNGPYGEFAKKHAKVIDETGTMGSQPIVVAETIFRAAEARRPKTRYATGRGASSMLLLRRILSDRMLDRLLLGVYGR
jgi:short-subunit dehydrogenase